MTRRILTDMKDLGNLIESVADAFAESFASRTRRNAGTKHLIAPPPPGTPLLVSLALALEHTGVYLGDNKVAELQDDGFVKTVSLMDFINGDTAPFPLRNGTRIFAACDARSRKPLGTGGFTVYWVGAILFAVVGGIIGLVVVLAPYVLRFVGIVLIIVFAIWGLGNLVHVPSAVQKMQKMQKNDPVARESKRTIAKVNVPVLPDF